MSVSQRLASIRERIAASGRDPAGVTIVAVTKGRPLDLCREALACGLTILGENRVQEALPKIAALPEAEWHLIGHLQTNKVKHAVEHFRVIQSVDSVALAEAIAKRSAHRAVLVEVNVGREPQRTGVDPGQAVEVASKVAGLLDLQGLMGMGPATGNAAPAFRELKRLHTELEQRLGRRLPVLSMGMSGDYELALAEGSTMLRLGRALFG